MWNGYIECGPHVHVQVYGSDDAGTVKHQFTPPLHMYNPIMNQLPQGSALFEHDAQVTSSQVTSCDMAFFRQATTASLSTSPTATTMTTNERDNAGYTRAQPHEHTSAQQHEHTSAQLHEHASG
ncbi:uncharacterized protein LACBIDRAFT_332979 [Laccaria bicolor S238N-H82]|uniref:Predicted protein n=1 Tax=Laccaria bicolor (strain S238N-H82 / ATCC MYA-4686) TaxID=486041 RepID=B0DUF8_LACBS|nr:uncharacterized protein LACBIDRAFT_332979 [Laccaria bicolor S238N-H82]EDR01797.1 predicted protein [Laccaria bicolor S238N-H82]|eukprot:XP_001887610.1 predicted protein [Laccaria bicolor S238N-H82]